MAEYEREIELYDYIEVLLKYKWFILAATLVCGIAGWYMRTEPPPPLYEADVVLIIKQLSTQEETGEGQKRSTGQSSGFYETLARDDGLKKVLRDSLKLKDMSLTAMDNILKVQILDPGVKLTVRHANPALPIAIVNTWAKLFVERNSDLNSEEGGLYYDYVEQQYQAVRNRLDSTETALHAFENDNKIGFMQIQQTALDSSSTGLYNNIVRIEAALLDTNLVIRTTGIQLQSILPDYRPTYQKALNYLQTLDTSTAQDVLYNSTKNILRQFDEDTRFAHWAELYLSVEIANLEKELTKVPTILGNTPNPIYLQLAERLNVLRLEHDYPDRSKIPQPPAAMDLDMSEVREIYRTLKEQRHRIKSALDLTIQRWVYKTQRRSLEQLQHAIGDSLTVKMREHQRLQRNHELFLETLGRLSTLVEEARISRAKSANNIRILTQALEVRSISQGAIEQKTAIAAGVGLLLSSILALLIEYMRKAKARRAGTA